MHRLHLLSAICLCAAQACAAPTASSAAPSETAALFFGHGDIDSAALSPDGRLLAVIDQPKGKGMGVVLVDLPTMQRRELVRYDIGELGGLHWLSPSRLTFARSELPKHLLPSSSGLHAISVDGGKLKGLTRATPKSRSLLIDRFSLEGDRGGIFFGIRSQRTPDIHVAVSYSDGKGVGYLNSLDMIVQGVYVPPDSYSWIIDEDDKLRVALSDEGEATVVHVATDRRWEKHASFTPDAVDAFVPVLYSREGSYVLASKGDDRVALYRYSYATRTMDDKPVLASAHFDVRGSIVTDDTKLIGFRTLFEDERTVWFDEDMKALQTEIDALLPATNNRLSRARRHRTPFHLVESSSGTEPGITYVYNRATKKLQEIGRARPDIDATRLAVSQREHFVTRDGRKLAVQVTLPKGAVYGKSPAVIMLPTQTWSRNAFPGWDHQVQFLAARGYAVIEPETRGTRGYGKLSLNAGNHQIGLGMQDDIADSARWAAAQGYADADRICIAGSALGGHAALMGVVRDPGLYRCAVSIAGITELTLLSARPSGPRYAYKYKTIGDPGVDSERFIATSLLKQAHRISRPVWLGYEASEISDPERRGKEFFDALKAGSPGSELHIFDAPDGTPTPHQVRAEMWTRIDDFLQKHTAPRR